MKVTKNLQSSPFSALLCMRKQLARQPRISRIISRMIGLRTPKKVIFCDDKSKNLWTIQGRARSLGVGDSTSQPHA